MAKEITEEVKAVVTLQITYTKKSMRGRVLKMIRLGQDMFGSDRDGSYTIKSVKTELPE